MRRFCVGFALVALSACGRHTFINIVDATAARGADDHVTVTATLECEAAGSADCAAAQEYCVTATWKRSAGSLDGGTSAGDAGTPGDVVDTAKACKSEVLAGNAKTELDIVSTKPIPQDGPIAITLSIQSASGGRNDLSRLQTGKAPLPSPWSKPLPEKGGTTHSAPPGAEHDSYRYREEEEE